MKIFNKILPVGSRSVLWGAHCWFIHPFFVALAWKRLYGWPKDWRLWAAFFLHDLGYLFQRCQNMDGDEGERHVVWGADVLRLLVLYRHTARFAWQPALNDEQFDAVWRESEEWYDFSLYHSRFYAKRDGVKPSCLCIADKLAVALEPWWLYLPRVIATGEIHEYMARAGGQQGSKYDGEPVVSKYLSMGVRTRTKRQWHSDMTEYLRKWVDEHKDGRSDTWTPEARP